MLYEPDPIGVINKTLNVLEIIALVILFVVVFINWNGIITGEVPLYYIILLIGIALTIPFVKSIVIALYKKFE
jgi:hypothetical protein